MSKEYYGCFECGKPLEKFKDGIAYSLGCFWQNPFCSRKCAISNAKIFIERIPINESKQHFSKIEQGMNQKEAESKKEAGKT